MGNNNVHCEDWIVSDIIAQIHNYDLFAIS